jgi:hypothetical protein
MRITRVIAVLVALALMALASIALTSGASSAAEAAQQAKPKHDVFASGKEIRNSNKFVAYGRVSTFKGRNITVQRKNCGTCGWKFYKKTKTSEERGKFRTRIAPGQQVPSRVCYRVVVPSTKNYRRTKAPVGCIKTVRN